MRCQMKPLIISFILLFFSLNAGAAIRGVCSNCHTMHNSQNGQSASFNSVVNDSLTKGDCIGCHAQGGSSEIVEVGVDSIPQVYHNSAVDLAGGNFAYIDGTKGGNASDAKGHNVAALVGTEDTLSSIPGAIELNGYGPHPNFSPTTLTCAGSNGCHGNRPSSGEFSAISGAHHGNIDGQITNPITTGSSYRFLLGVKGLESPNWKNESESSHNEYYGVSNPVKLGCNSGNGEYSCHNSGSSGVDLSPPNGTISQFCMQCHGEFHVMKSDMGAVIQSPFIRHPVDYTIPSSDEYSNYTLYSIEAPVARISVPSNPSSTVTPGSDVVMCLSCHYAHGSNYPDMLRWDYSKNIAGGSASGGCLTCHTSK